MTPNRTKAILEVLSRGREEKVARAVLTIFGASSFEECFVAFELVGSGLRSSFPKDNQQII